MTGLPRNGHLVNAVNGNLIEGFRQISYNQNMADNEEIDTQAVKNSNASAASMVINETSTGDQLKNTENSEKYMDTNGTDETTGKGGSLTHNEEKVDFSETKANGKSGSDIKPVAENELPVIDDTSKAEESSVSSTTDVFKKPADDTELSKDQKATTKADSTESAAMKPCQDVSLKHLANRYTCIGPAHLISKLTTTASHAPNSETIAPKEEKTCADLKTVKYAIRNVTKSSKIVKVSNLDYHIKPVRKNIFLGKNQKIQYPIVFVGEPSFIDADDYKDLAKDVIKSDHSPTLSEMTPSPPEIKEESLYNITSLENSFVSPSDLKSIKTEIRKFFYPTPDSIQPTFIRQMNIPFPHQASLPKPGFNMPRNFVLNSNLSNTNGMVRFVARTVPSATLASSVFTSVKPTVSSQKISLPKSQNIKPGQNAVQNMNVKPLIHIQTKKPITKPKQSTMNIINVPIPISTQPVTVSSKPLIKLKPIPALKPVDSKVPTSLTLKTNQNIMKVKILPSVNKATTKVQTVSSASKTSMPVQILSSLPNASKLITVGTGGSGGLMSKKPTTAIFVPAKANKETQSVSTARKSIENKNTPILQVIENASAALAKIVTKHKIDAVKTNSNSTSAQLAPVKSKASHNKPLREGVEVTFEDGVRHFITSLRQITYLDDEPVKSWSDLKKGVKVAARWTDGLIYDATVVSCYFSTDKKNTTTSEPGVKLQKIDSDPSTKLPRKKQRVTMVSCTNCKNIFTSLKMFRKHQKRICKKGRGLIMHNGASFATEMLDTGVKNDGNSNAKDTAKPTASNNKEVEKNECNSSNFSAKIERNNIVENTKSTITASNFVINSAQKRKASPLNGPEKNYDKLAKKKRKTSSNPIKADNTEVLKNEKQLTKKTGANFLFKKGTQFLHRWQLDDGGSEWYQGEVIKVLSTPKSILESEFEVLYKGEDEVYNLKLYEDYPTDIRIMGQS